MYHRWQNEKFQWQLVQHHVLKNLHHPQAQQQVKGINFPAIRQMFLNVELARGFYHVVSSVNYSKCGLYFESKSGGTAFKNSMIPIIVINFSL